MARKKPNGKEKKRKQPKLYLSDVGAYFYVVVVKGGRERWS